jgi:hypothetical protein
MGSIALDEVASKSASNEQNGNTYQSSRNRAEQQEGRYGLLLSAAEQALSMLLTRSIINFRGRRQPTGLGCE